MNRNQQEVHLIEYWNVLVKRRNIAIAVFLVITILFAVYTFFSTPLYKGSVQILFDMRQNPTMNFVEDESGFVQMRDSRAYYNTQMEILHSRAFADRVVRKLELDKNDYFLEKKKEAGGFLSGSLSAVKKAVFGSSGPGSGADSRFSSVETSDELDPVLTDIVLDGIRVEMGKESNIMNVGFVSDSPVISAGMANAIASAYIEHNLEIRVRPFRDAVDWLSAKMRELRSKVETTERDLQVYKEGEGIVSFESKENVLTQELQELITQLVQLEAKRNDAEIRYNQIKSVMNTPELLYTVPDIMNNLVIQGLRKEEISLKTRLSELSEKYGPKHPQMLKARSELDMLQENLLAEARKMLNAAKTEYEIVKSREDSLRKRIEEQKKTVLDLSRKAIEFNVVAGEAWSNKRFYEILLNKLQEASLSSGINVSNAQVIDHAVIPDKPISPKKGFNLILALILGVGAGTGLAFFVEYMDDSIKSQKDVDERLGLPFLGYVPASGTDDKVVDTSIFSQPSSIIAESYRTLRTSVMLSSVDKPPHILLVTSSLPSEGKTTTATNLAIAMAQTGEKVLLVDSDLRHNNVHKMLGIENKEGLTDLMIGKVGVDSVVRNVSSAGKLDVITAGRFTPNPLEMLSSEKMKQLLTHLRSKYDRIVLDSPPLLAVSDPLALSREVDGVVMVVAGDSTGREAVLRATRSLAKVKAHLLGVVLNKVALGKGDNYGYYYYHDHPEVEEAGESTAG